MKERLPKRALANHNLKNLKLTTDANQQVLRLKRYNAANHRMQKAAERGTNDAGFCSPSEFALLCLRFQISIQIVTSAIIIHL